MPKAPKETKAPKGSFAQRYVKRHGLAQPFQADFEELSGYGQGEHLQPPDPAVVTDASQPDSSCAFEHHPGGAHRILETITPLTSAFVPETLSRGQTGTPISEHS